jgi:Flp pilus assembly protein TadD
VGQAQALIAVGRHADAVPLLHRAITAEPEGAWPRCVLASCFIGMGGLDAASEAVRLSPGDADAMLALGEAQLANRQFEEAERSADRVLALDPASSDGHYLLGRIALGRKDWAEAEGHCREALRIEPRNWIVMNNLGVALQGQGRHKDAVAAFENAAKMNPKAELVRRNLFSQTQRYVGVGVITILVVQGIRLAFITHAGPVAFAVGLAILLLGAWVVYIIRKRQLSPTVRQFYELEGRRRWPLTLGYMVFFYGGLLLILVTTLVVYGRTHASIALLALVVGCAGWGYGGTRLWRNTILPRLDPKERG